MTYEQGLNWLVRAPWHRYPLKGAHHPERPWWQALLRPMIPESTLLVGCWLRSDGQQVLVDDAYNTLPTPESGLLELRRIDAESPLAMPPVLCGQVWQMEDATGGALFRDALVTELRYRGSGEVTQVAMTQGTRVAEIPSARLAKAVLLAGPGAPWASASWVERNRRKWEQGL